MRLLRLRLANFKGIRDFTLEPQGRDINVMGANATGKTTLADSFAFLLFGKNSAGATDFNVLPLDPDGKRVDGVTEASVEAVLAYDGDGIHDGKQVTLRRVFREIWTKKRGRSEAEFSGHETVCFIDDVPKKAGEYAAFIKEMADEEKMKLLTNPRYFNEILDWKKRRQVVMGLDGTVTDADVMASDPELEGLADALKGRTVEDYRKVVEAEIKKTNQELDKLPVRIDEAGKSLPDAAPLPGDLKAMRKDRADRATLLASVDAGGGVAEKTKALREIEGQVVDLDNRHRQSVRKEVEAVQRELDKANADVRRVERDILTCQDGIEREDAKIKASSKSLEVLAEAWEKATAETFEHVDVYTCYACQQPLPECDVRASHDKALADFNLRKARKVEGIEAEGNAMRDLLKKAQGERGKAEALRAELTQVLADHKLALANLLEKARAIEARQSEPSPDPARHQLVDKQLGLESEIADLKRGAVNPAKDKLAAEIANLDSLIAETEKAAANNERRQAGLKRVEELKAQQKSLGKTYESLEHQRDLCERFLVAKAQTLTDKINGQFKMAKFRLFEKQINGGINDQVCEVTVNGVPYSDLNGAAKTNVGLDVINTLSQVYDFTAPIVIDNSESVCELLPTKGQQIRLYVSAKDAALRVEAN